MSVVALLGAFATTVATQPAPSPDFSGQWTIDPARSHVSKGPLKVATGDPGTSNIQPPRKIKDVPPAYPADAMSSRLSGTVLLRGIIDRQGHVADLRLIKSIPEFDRNAMNAVWQWEYTPVLVDGAPGEVEMTVTVTFAVKNAETRHLDGVMVPSLLGGFGTGLGLGLVAHELSIAQDAKGFVVSREIGGLAQKVRYAPDAKPVKNKLEQYGSAKDNQYQYSSRWDGGQLVTDITWSGPKSERAARETMTRDGDTLTIVTTRRDATTGADEFVQTAVYSRRR